MPNHGHIYHIAERRADDTRMTQTRLQITYLRRTTCLQRPADSDGPNYRRNQLNEIFAELSDHNRVNY